MMKVALGMIVGMLGFAYIAGPVIKSTVVALDECQKKLPKNQHCKVLAVPEKVENE